MLWHGQLAQSVVILPWCFFSFKDQAGVTHHRILENERSSVTTGPDIVIRVFAAKRFVDATNATTLGHVSLNIQRDFPNRIDKTNPDSREVFQMSVSLPRREEGAEFGYNQEVQNEMENVAGEQDRRDRLFDRHPRLRA